jgi:predicted choloylglycine hydrolase
MNNSHFEHIDSGLFYTEQHGSSEQIGECYGEAIHKHLNEVVIRVISNIENKFDYQKALIAVDEISKVLYRTFPYFLPEISGISRGSNIPLEKLHLLLFSGGIRLYLENDCGCTDIIFPDSDTGPLLGKTHDATTPDTGNAIVRLIRHESKNTILCVTRPDGISTMTGLNNKGLAIGEASLHFHDRNKHGTIRNLLLRPVLHECGDVPEAVEFLKDHPTMVNGFNFALVDNEGKAAIVERSPSALHVRWCDGNPIFCTNHAVSPHIRALGKSRGELADNNSDERFNNLDKLLLNNNISLSLDSLKRVLAFHDKKGGICQHGDPDYHGEKQQLYPLFTQRAFINIVQSSRLLVYNSGPCRDKFFEFSINK